MAKKSFLLWIVFMPLLLAAGWIAAHKAVGHPVEVVHSTRGPAVQAIYATGTVEATVMMPIAARASARLMELNADEGSDVKKDQVLAKLEDADLQQTIQQLHAQEDFAEKAFQRQEGLLKKGFVSQEDYDRAQSNLEAAKAATAKATSQADFMKLLAPADGRILRRDGEIGQLIPANQPVFWLSCCAPLRISAEVDEEDIALVQPGLKVLIRADAFPGKIFHGTVQSITPKGDPVSRSYRVRVEFTEETPLLIGMTAETNIIIHEHENALLLPAGAVTQDSVWLVRDGKLARATIALGAKGQDQVEILSGIAPEDVVVLKPDAVFKEGQKVRVNVVK